MNNINIFYTCDICNSLYNNIKCYKCYTYYTCTNTNKSTSTKIKNINIPIKCKDCNKLYYHHINKL